jgi:hypothetical protein
LNVRCIMRAKLHHLVMSGGMQGWSASGHHPEDREVITRLVTFSATFILIIYDVFSDITVNILIAITKMNQNYSCNPLGRIEVFFDLPEVVSFASVNGQDNDGNENDGKAHEDGDEEVHIEVQSDNGGNKFLITTRSVIFAIGRTTQIIQ